MLLMFCITHFQPDSLLLLKNEQTTGKRTAAYYSRNQRISNQTGNLRATIFEVEKR